MVFSFRASEHFKVFGWHSLFLSVVFCFLAIICVSVVDQFLVGGGSDIWPHCGTMKDLTLLGPGETYLRMFVQI